MLLIRKGKVGVSKTRVYLKSKGCELKRVFVEGRSNTHTYIHIQNELP